MPQPVGTAEASPGVVNETPAPAARPRIDYLDGLRAVAALYVVLHHIWLTEYPSYPHYTGPWWLGWLAYGQVAVSIFIVVSGFSLAIAPARQGWRLRDGSATFIRRRAWRILPTYWSALLLSALIYGVLTASQTGNLVTGRGMLVHSLLLQDIVSSESPNGAFWSIAVEWQIYFLFPLLLLTRRLRGAAAVVCLAGVAVLGVYFLAGHVPALTALLHLTPQFLLLFALGMVAAGGLQIKDHGRWPAAWAWIGLGCAAVTVTLLVRQDLEWVQREYFWIDLLVGLTTAFLLRSFTGDGIAWLRAVLTSRPLRSVGAYSYSLYCIHLPVLWLIWYVSVRHLHLTPLADLVGQLLVCLPGTLLAAYLFYRCFERPFLTIRSFREVAERLRPTPRRRQRWNA